MGFVGIVAVTMTVPGTQIINHGGKISWTCVQLVVGNMFGMTLMAYTSVTDVGI